MRGPTSTIAITAAVVGRQRLLAQHVLARLQGGDRQCGVGGVHGGDVDRVDIRVGQDLVVAARPAPPPGACSAAKRAGPLPDRSCRPPPDVAPGQGAAGRRTGGRSNRARARPSGRSARSMWTWQSGSLRPAAGAAVHRERSPGDRRYDGRADAGQYPGDEQGTVSLHATEYQPGSEGQGVDMPALPCDSAEDCVNAHGIPGGCSSSLTKRVARAIRLAGCPAASSSAAAAGLGLAALTTGPLRRLQPQRLDLRRSGRARALVLEPLDRPKLLDEAAEQIPTPQTAAGRRDRRHLRHEAADQSRGQGLHPRHHRGELQLRALLHQRGPVRRPEHPRGGPSSSRRLLRLEVEARDDADRAASASGRWTPARPVSTTGRDLFDKAGLPTEPDEVGEVVRTWDGCSSCGGKLRADSDVALISQRYDDLQPVHQRQPRALLRHRQPSRSTPSPTARSGRPGTPP